METALSVRTGARNATGVSRLEERIRYIESMVANGGPDPSEYAAFGVWLKEVDEDLRAGYMSRADLSVLRRAFGEALSSETLQGFSYSKPHGYSGDFEIIDRIYTEHTSDNTHLRKWDVYCHSQSGPKAVRNRKSYFVQLLRALASASGSDENASVLNVASGPCRDILEFLSDPGDKPCDFQFECVDSDAQAIEFAGNLCSPFASQVSFTKANALRYRPNRQFRLIWSAGLFDYLEDNAFAFLLTNLLSMLEDKGELVIGNFARGNPTRPYMEIVGDWYLNHRSDGDLVRLAKACGIHQRDIRIGQEPEGVNLFLHIKRGRRFIGS
ncbi:MAG TPA: class I SAM-dependent methyltransferase [Rhodothermales bacterium]|nr:class I SAM-dependent methyltransferase [Rhodothermales bacterium]